MAALFVSKETRLTLPFVVVGVQLAHIVSHVIDKGVVTDKRER